MRPRAMASTTECSGAADGAARKRARISDHQGEAAALGGELPLAVRTTAADVAAAAAAATAWAAVEQAFQLVKAAAADESAAAAAAAAAADESAAAAVAASTAAAAEAEIDQALLVVAAAATAVKYASAAIVEAVAAEAAAENAAAEETEQAAKKIEDAIMDQALAENAVEVAAERRKIDEQHQRFCAQPCPRCNVMVQEMGQPGVDAAQIMAQGVLVEPTLAVWPLHRVRRRAQRRRERLQAIEGGSQECPSADQVDPRAGMSWVWQEMGRVAAVVQVERQKVLVPRMLGRVSAATSSIPGGEGVGKSGGNAAAQAAGLGRSHGADCRGSDRRRREGGSIRAGRREEDRGRGHGPGLQCVVRTTGLSVWSERLDKECDVRFSVWSERLDSGDRGMLPSAHFGRHQATAAAAASAGGQKAIAWPRA
jgi:hypothetical protein